MAKRYVYELPEWPSFSYDYGRIAESLAYAHIAQGRLIGKLEAIGFKLRSESALRNISSDILKSSEIEGMFLKPDQVRSSVARKLGLPAAGLHSVDRNIDGFVEILLDATQNYGKPLSEKRLCSWHRLLFPDAISGFKKIDTGKWRRDKTGPMQVVSGRIDKPRIHFVAPAAKRLNGEMKKFLHWFNGTTKADSIIKSALAHFWFVTIHPFEDGNGRIARVIGDIELARCEKTPQRFYSLSSQIARYRKQYYDELEKAQSGSLDLTLWVKWYIDMLIAAIHESESGLKGSTQKARFWEEYETLDLNSRQRVVLNRLFDGLVGKLTSSKWATLVKCSQDTAIRDIQSLVKLGVLQQEKAGGRSTSYVLHPEPNSAFRGESAKNSAIKWP